MVWTDASLMDWVILVASAVLLVVVAVDSRRRRHISREERFRLVLRLIDRRNRGEDVEAELREVVDIRL